MSLDIAKSFTYMFEDPQAVKKLAIGTGLVLLGMLFVIVLVGLIPLIIALGYTLEVTRNVREGRANPLPEWDDWGRFFSRGLKLCVVALVWCLPLLIVLVPSALGSAMMNSNGDFAHFVGVLFTLCGSCLSILWGLIFALFLPALYVRLAETDRISSGFEFAQLWQMTRANLANVIIAVVMTWVAGLIASIVAMAGLIALLIGIVVTMPFAIFWQYLVQAHLFGQVGLAASPSMPATTV